MQTAQHSAFEANPLTIDRILADASARDNPHAVYAELRRTSPIYKTSNGMWVCTGHKAAQYLLRHPKMSRAEAARVELGLGQPMSPELEQALRADSKMMVHMDEPNHMRVRQLVRHAFLPGAIESWTSRVRSVSKELVDRVIDKAEFNFLDEVAFPLPEIVICEMLGVPHADHSLWSKWSHAAVSANRTPMPTGENLRKVQEAVLGFNGYFKNLIAKRREELGDDLVSVLIRAEEKGDKLTEDEIIGPVTELIQAGHETTANLLANGMQILFDIPAVYRQLHEQPERIPDAIQEFLRLDGSSHFGLPRVALEDIEFEGVTIPAGDKILFIWLAINRDPTVFENPDTVDINRDNQHQHMAFGYGPHSCLGRQLALLESSIMFKEVLTRMPDLEMVERPHYAPVFTRGLQELKVRRRSLC